ncbi:MAG TPA: flagellar hook-basal body complex protein FliE [Kofleriaceae bacterium]|nr:flagellar hook-basal body complex protein FliE [Kofleriaceae bacterium]
MNGSVGNIGSRPVIGELYDTGAARPARADAAARGPDFGDVLLEAVEGAAGSERAATEASTRFAAGDPSVGIHEVIIASEKASIAVRYATTLKNKLLDAYRELMNTQV